MSDRRRATGTLVAVVAIAALMTLAGCGSSSDAGGGTAAATTAPSAPTLPPATTPQAAVDIVQQWAAAANHAAVHLVTSLLPPIEEGPALEMDTAQYQAFVEFLKPIQPFTLSDIITVVPRNGAYPTSFLAEAAAHTGSAVTKYLLVFAKDDAGSAWKLAAYLVPIGDGPFPSFALDAHGYGTALDAASMLGYPATASGIAGAYCNYFGTIFGATKQVPSAPALSFAPGQLTSGYVSDGKKSTGDIRSAGGTSEGTYAPESYSWAYKLADGSAFDIVTVLSTLDQAAAANTHLSVPAVFPFFAAGSYSTTRQASEGTIGVVEPTSGTTETVTMQYTQYTRAQAS